MRIDQLLESDGVYQLNLYRGVEARDSTQPYIIDVRTDRRPRDASIAFSALFNLGIERKLGIPNIRKRACFCTTSKSTARSYASYFDERGDVVQLGVPISAKIVFDPQVEDSILKAEKMPIEWYEFVMEHATVQVQGTQSISRADYMALPPIELFQHFGQQHKVPADKMEEYMQLVLDAADQIAQGYQSVSPGSFTSPGKDVECMIVDASQIEATVLVV